MAEGRKSVWGLGPVRAWLAVLAAANVAAAIEIEDVQVTQWVGEGANRALLVVDWQAPTTIVLGYRWDGAVGGATMMNDIATLGGRLSVAWHPNYPDQAVFGMGFDVDGDGGGFSTTAPGVETGQAQDADDYYAEGWMVQGYWAFYTAPDGQHWNWPGYGIAGLQLTDGAWVGWSWSPAPTWYGGPPDNIPLIPEPATAMLAAAGLMLFRRGKRLEVR